MNVRVLFKIICRLDKRFFTEMISKKLHADGKAPGRKSAWHRYAGNTGQVGRQGENVGQIHRERIACFFPDFKGRGGGHRREEYITGLEGGFKIPGNKSPYLGGFSVVSIVVTCGQRIRSQNNAPLNRWYISISSSASLSLNPYFTPSYRARFELASEVAIT